ncbi:hypothetical protein wTpre_330 [Wolbachia endosymbiont of Trichogramma pretiosum]|nr:hypothetical protein wTpre_330 [Wolbachia endosymbiont of Trichogramma pretiosum]
MGVTAVQTFVYKGNLYENGQCLLCEHCDLGLKNASSPFGVIQVLTLGSKLQVMH